MWKNRNPSGLSLWGCTKRDREGVLEMEAMLWLEKNESQYPAQAEEHVIKFTVKCEDQGRNTKSHNLTSGQTWRFEEWLYLDPQERAINLRWTRG